jgi:ADYC domain-containing protein/pentapeptide repeat protein
MIKQSMIPLLLVCGACAASGEDQLGEVSQNGISYNGLSFNGVSFNGISFNGVSFNGASLSGVSINGVSSTGSALKAGSTSGPPLSGSSLVGSIWTGTTTGGTTVKLRIDSAAAGTSPNTDLWFYGMSYQTSTGWSPLCGTDSVTGAPIQAVSVAGYWAATASDATHYAISSTQFTLACRGATIAKCVELGYKTYKGYTNQLLSCVRLLRGDYCGTGIAHTVNGTQVNLYDSVGVQKDTESWLAEAEWTPSGARCVNINNMARYNLAVQSEPSCVSPLKLAACGLNFNSGAILIDELPPDLASQIQSSP